MEENKNLTPEIDETSAEEGKAEAKRFRRKSKAEKSAKEAVTQAAEDTSAPQDTVELN